MRLPRTPARHRLEVRRSDTCSPPAGRGPKGDRRTKGDYLKSSRYANYVFFVLSDALRYQELPF